MKVGDKVFISSDVLENEPTLPEKFGEVVEYRGEEYVLVSFGEILLSFRVDELEVV